MPKKGNSGGSSSSKKTVAALGFYPQLPKTAAAVGKYASVPGKHWDGCPASDKEKRFLCSILEFVAVHDFSFRKGPGFKLKEMGVDGQGSLEPGVASGDEFVHGYPSPFLEYYYYANRGELSADLRKQLYPRWVHHS